MAIGATYGTKEEQISSGQVAAPPTQMTEGQAPSVPSMQVGGTPPPPSTAPKPPLTPNQDGGAGGGRPAPPPPVPVPPPPVQFNVAGAGGGEGASSFARPGSAAARPFRSMDFLQSRMQGGGPTEMGRRVGFGAGAALTGGAAAPTALPGGGFGEIAQPGGPADDELARLMASIAGRYQGGQ